MHNILITSSGRRVSLVQFFKKELKLKSPESKVFVSDASVLLSAAAQIADGYFETYLLSDSRYIEDLLDKCIRRNISLVIPTIDTELKILAQNKARFENHNIKLVVSDTNFIDSTENKLASNDFFNSLHLPTILVYPKDNYKFPLFIKPLNGSSGIDNYIVKNKSEMRDYFFENENLFFSEYLDKKRYDEYTCDLYYDKNCDLKCIVPRKRIEVRGGEVSKAVTEKNNIIYFVENNMSHIQGVRGCVTLPVFLHKTEENLFGIEINARFGGGYPLSYLAGANFPKWIIEEYLFDESINYYDAWENNLLMLRYDEAILVRNYED
jgi:carbamoyl-phosphate synthase large subunit